MESSDAKQETADRKLHGIDWAGIEHAYLHSGWSVQRIADAYGPSDTTIRKRAKARGWVRLVATVPLRGGRPPRPPGLPEAKKPSVKIRRQRSYVKRLYRLLDSQLSALEACMADTSKTSSALEIERAARGTNTIAGCYHKIVELEEAARKAGKASETSAVRSEEDADRLRRDLAERLERLTPASPTHGS
ncbi:MAG: hypothetical protein FJX44_05785 [Alphaproteobacteria bacterium]|nr:hypothetical protein [Alphaproteobacteria bacterium]